MKAVYDHTLYLMRCALCDHSPDPKALQDTDFDAIYDFSRFHGVTALIAHALEKMSESDCPLTQEQKAKYKEAKYQIVSRFVRQKAEAQRICAACEKAAIRYMPLKRILIRDYYPAHLREMGDLDILIDEARCEDARQIMLDMGYTVQHYGELYHDTYYKSPIYHVELHKGLFHPEAQPVFARYYDHVFDRLTKVDGKKYEYAFTKEDFYIFMVAHAVKHLNGPGTGLRTLSDTFLYERREQLDEDILSQAFRELAITEEVGMLRRIAMTVFDTDTDLTELPLNEKERKMLEFILKSGIHGTYSHVILKRYRVMNNGQNTKIGKLRYIRSRMRLTPEQMKKKYPFFYEHKWSRPFLVFRRLYLGATVKRKSLIEELTTIKKI